MKKAEATIENNLKCIIFDLDGTLLDTSPGIIECVKYAAKKLGFSELPQAELRSFVGPPLRDSFRRCYGCSKEEAENLTVTYRAYYREKALLNAEPYEGIFEVCERIKNAGIQIAVATAKPQQFAELVLQHFGFDRFVSILHGADLEGTLQKPDLISACVKDAEVLPEQCLMIGDTEHDAKGAQLAAVPFLAVSYGFGDLKRMKEYPSIGTAVTPMDIWEHMKRKAGRE